MLRFYRRKTQYRRPPPWTWKGLLALALVVVLALAGIGCMYAVTQGWMEPPPNNEPPAGGYTRGR